MPSPGESTASASTATGIPRVRLLTVSLEGWPSLGAEATLRLSEQKTVLVGRNGAGKSLLLEGIYWGTQSATAQLPNSDGRTIRLYPETFRCTLAIGPTNKNVSYEATLYPRSNELRSDRSERCLDTKTKQPLWTVKDGVAQLADGKQIPVPVGLGLLSFDRNLIANIGEATALQHFFSGIERVESGLPRPGGRKAGLVTVENGQVREMPPGRIGRLTTAIVRAWLDKSGRLEEFTKICRQVGIAQDITIRSLPFPGGPAPVEWVFIWWDGTDIGELSDGTLRTAEILWTLLSLGESGLLILEEPETGIHPGLLKRLLAVIDSYAIEHQVLVSTHSMQVVNWARAEEIRLVERSRDRTTAQPLSQEQIARLGAYLDDEGSLGDFIYGGGADD